MLRTTDNSPTFFAKVSKEDTINKILTAPLSRVPFHQPVIQNRINSKGFLKHAHSNHMHFK